MTEQDLNSGRIKAWDDYQKALEVLLTHKGKIKEWSKTFKFIAAECRETPLNLKQYHFSGMPTAEEIKELCSTLEEDIVTYKHCRSEALKFRWPVGDSEV